MRTNENQTYVIPVVNRKGGVAKTTTAEEVAYILAAIVQKRVLLIDADSQANLTWQIMDKRLQYGGLSALLRDASTDYRGVVMHTDVPRLDIIPASRDLGRLDLEILIGKFKADFLALQRICKAVKANGDYDFVIIDCPPYYSASCVNAIGAADGIIIPTNTDNNSVMGVNEVVEEISTLRDICPDAKVLGCLVTGWQRSPIDEDALEHLRSECDVPVFKTVIRRSAECVRGASWEKEPIQVNHPFCNAGKDYRAFVVELLNLLGVAYD